MNTQVKKQPRDDTAAGKENTPLQTKQPTPAISEQPKREADESEKGLYWWQQGQYA